MHFLLYIPLFLFLILFLFILFVLMDEPSLKVIYRTFWRDIRHKLTPHLLQEIVEYPLHLGYLHRSDPPTVGQCSALSVLISFGGGGAGENLFLTAMFFFMQWTFKRGLHGYAKIFLFVLYGRLRNLTIVDLFNKNVKRYPKNVCFIFEDEEWTYKQVDELSNKIAHCFIREGFRRGDEVALLLDNSPDYVCIWLGLAKIGVTTALINTSLKAESLAHSMNVINMKGLIFGQNFAEAVDKTTPFLHNVNSSTFYCYTRKSEEKMFSTFPCEHLNVLLDESLPLCEKKIKNNFLDNVLYVYTSGTTGLPKAVVIKHRRIWLAAGFGKYIMGLNELQTFYNTLPLYHASGGVLFPSIILVFGGKMVIRRKFSASNFWKDVVKHNATTCVYIGELCRYLLNAPKVPEETQHSVNLMIGNGLTPHVWKEFQERFRIKKIIEFYASSEGNTTVVNYEGKTGAVGFITRIFFKIQGVYLIKIHPETGEIMRDSEGLCIRCKPGEPGQLVGKISKFNQIKAFDGYINSTDSKRKIIKDCFRKGDMAFASGDILVMDEDGYLYFKDRCGDTFRWKGENVSTTEVENILSKISNFASCVVYGVKVPDSEGRIGMAAIQVDDLKKVNFDKLHQDLSERLPTYAIPAFIRISNHIEATGTYKLKKVNLQEEGYNREKISDLLYVLDTRKKAYVPLTREIYIEVLSGRMKF